MKKLAILVAAVALATAPAYATEQPAATTAKPEKAEGKRAERFKAADANNDGALSREEFTAEAANRAAEVFTQIDKNGDGKVTREEMKAHGNEMRAKFKAGKKPE